MKTQRNFGITLCLLFFSLSAFHCSAQENKQSTSRLNQKALMQFESVREKIREWVEKGEVPSVSVAVAKDGQIIWEESFGWADREKMIKATPNTMYSIASVSKPITATGLMVLVEKGEIDLNSSVNKYLYPNKIRAYKGVSDSIKVKHLLHHSSGLPLHSNFFYEDEPIQKPKMEDAINHYGISVYPVGKVYQYSNFGYGLLSHIIHKVSGKSFEAFMKNEVFLPLGLTHSSLNIGLGLEDYAAVRYDKENNPIPFYHFDHDGASAFYCSSHDLIRFGMFHLKNRIPGQTQILSDKTLDQMHTERDPGVPIEDSQYYALGWVNILDENGYNIITHDGGMPGVSSTLDLIPSENVAIVILMNCIDKRLYSLREDILCAILPKYKENLSKKENSEDAEQKDNEIPITGEWEGTVCTYESKFPVSMLFQEDGDIFVTLKTSGLESICPKKLVMVSFENNRLRGLFCGTIPTGDAMRRKHFVVLEALLGENRLSGYVAAMSYEKRDYFELSSYITLERIKR